MNIRAGRLRSVTEARNGFSRLVADAEDGLNTHIVMGGQVMAHLVPLTAPVVDDKRLRDELVVALAVSEAGVVVNSAQWREGRFGQVPEHIGPMLAWAWEVDGALFDKGLASFHAALCENGGRAVEAGEVWEWLRPALIAHLSAGELDEMRARWDRPNA